MANRSGVSSQNISRTDILAEGPVRGLKNGSSSIFFNDVASEDANVRGYNPVEGTASGKITFDGTSLTNTSITGANLSTSLVNPTGAPRTLVLKDYRTVEVTVINASTAGTGFSVFTCTAASGTPFTTDWNTQQDYKTTAYLKAEGVLVKGQFLHTNSTTGSFTFFGLSDAIDTTKTYELRISVGFYIDSINSSSSLTLKSSYSGISGATPASGTYFFDALFQTYLTNKNPVLSQSLPFIANAVDSYVSNPVPNYKTLATWNITAYLLVNHQLNLLSIS